MCKSRIAVKEKDRTITDIDLLIWDNKRETFLVGELKWFYGADSVQEVINHDRYFSEGIRKTKKSIEYLKTNFKESFAKIGISSSSDNIRLYGIIISRTGTPSPFVDDPDFPVIEEADFKEIIAQGDGDVDKMFASINARIASKKHLTGVKESQMEIKVGDYLFILPAFEY